MGIQVTPSCSLIALTIWVIQLGQGHLRLLRFLLIYQRSIIFCFNAEPPNNL